MPSTGRTGGVYRFGVMPWRVGGTLWNMDMWQGRVTEGIEEADKIVSVERDYSDKPYDPQVMKTVRVFEEEI